MRLQIAEKYENFTRNRRKRGENALEIVEKDEKRI
jgi:hypothetical protein